MGCHKLDTAGALLPIFRIVLIFGSLMRELRLRKQVLRDGVGRDDGTRNYRYALQHRTPTDALFDRA